MSDTPANFDPFADLLKSPSPEISPLVELILQARAGGAKLEALPDAFTRELQADESVKLADCFRAMRSLALSYGQETFSLSARPMMSGTAELVFFRAAGCATVGEAMREIAHAYNVLHGAAYNRIDPRGRLVSYILDDENFPYTRPRDSFLHFSLECALIFLHSALCELADQDLAPFVRQVATRRPKQSGAETGTLRFWNAPIIYGGDVYSVTYDAAVLVTPLSRHRRHMPPDLAVHNRIISLIEAREARATRRESTETAVRRAFDDGLHDQGAIAERMRMSSATLRRRLAVEGVNFRELHKDLLNRRAREMLLESQDIGIIAESLGFSDTRSFTRAFKSWNGLTPSAYRTTSPTRKS